MTTLCNHGFFPHDCALCVKRPGECDFGSCTRLATTRVSSRPMCQRHAPAGAFGFAIDPHASGEPLRERTRGLFAAHVTAVRNGQPNVAGITFDTGETHGPEAA